MKNMKMSILILTFIIVAACGMINVHAAEPCWVNTTVLNCRENPSTSSNILTTFVKDTPLTIIGCDGGYWYEVWDGTTQGWCHKDYLRLTETAPEPSMRYIGDFRISYYTCSPSENGGWGVTALGHKLTSVVGTCIAVDPKIIPYGAKVYIDGVGYRTAMDCGGAIKGNKIDVLVRNHSNIPSCGIHYSKVYIVE